MRFIFLLIFLPVFSSANVSLPAFFSDNMVLQQNSSVAIWGKASAGKAVGLTTSWNGKSYRATADAGGKWKIMVQTPAAGGPFEIAVTETNKITLKNILIGEVWLCSGQSNMEMPMKGYRDQPILNSNDEIFDADNNEIRMYTVPRWVRTVRQDTAKPGKWLASNPENVQNFSATAYHFAKLLHKKLKVPIGLVHISYGGSSAETWMTAASLEAFPELKIPAVADSGKVDNKSPMTLYNGMLAPFIGYGIRGAIWYQGETNVGRADQYLKLFPAMVKGWRTEFGQGDFPFYFVQIAPFNYNSTVKNTSAPLRDAQRLSVNAIPNSGMAVIMDAGDESNIHPANKEIVGKRLALLALANTYGLKGFASSSPTVDSLSVSGGIATVRFGNARNGLTSYGKPLTQFEIAGADKVFRPAKAVIRNGTVMVSSPDVPVPVAVRYAYKDFVVGELFSTEGLPVSSFRTDNW